MTSDPVSTVRHIYDAFGRGDVPAVLAALAPEIQWQEAEGFLYADGNPYVGPTAVLHGVFGRIAGDWDNFQVQPQEILATTDGALAMGRYSGTYKGTGRRIDAQFAHVWRVTGGTITGFQQYTDTAQFSHAAAR